MKNVDFFDSLSTVHAVCRFVSLPSSYSWNTRFMWNYYFRVVIDGDSVFHIDVFHFNGSEYHLTYIVYFSLVHGIICVSDIRYSPLSIDLMKYSPDELRKTVPFLLGKFRNYHHFLYRFSLAAKTLDEEFFNKF